MGLLECVKRCAVGRLLVGVVLGKQWALFFAVHALEMVNAFDNDAEVIVDVFLLLLKLFNLEAHQVVIAEIFWVLWRALVSALIEVSVERTHCKRDHEPTMLYQVLCELLDLLCVYQLNLTTWMLDLLLGILHFFLLLDELLDVHELGAASGFFLFLAHTEPERSLLRHTTSTLQRESVQHLALAAVMSSVS